MTEAQANLLILIGEHQRIQTRMLRKIIAALIANIIISGVILGFILNNSV